MGYYSDPTAAQALGNINREFSKREKKAKQLLKFIEEHGSSPEALERAQAQFTGIYRHVLTHAIREAREKAERERLDAEQQAQE